MCRIDVPVGCVKFKVCNYFTNHVWRLEDSYFIVYVAFGKAIHSHVCLLYTSDAADDLLCVDLGGRRIIKKKNNHTLKSLHHISNALTPYTT